MENRIIVFVLALRTEVGASGRGHTLNRLTSQASSRLQGMTPTCAVGETLSAARKCSVAGIGGVDQASCLIIRS